MITPGDQEQREPDPEDAVETPTRQPPMMIGRLASDSSANGSPALPPGAAPPPCGATAAPLATLGEATAPDALVGAPVPGFGEAVVAAACCQGNFQALRNIAATLAQAPRGGGGGVGPAAAGAAAEAPWHSRPLDTAGNTALHSVLLGSWCMVREAEQQQKQQQLYTQAAAAAAAAAGSGGGSGTQAAQGGGGLLACCFGGGAAPLPDGGGGSLVGSCRAAGGVESPVSPPSSTFSGRLWSSSGGGSGVTGAGGSAAAAAAAAAAARPAHIDGHISCLSALLSFGADPSATNAARVTPAMLVALGALGGAPQTPRALAALVPNPRLANAADAAGRCALALAVRHLPEGSPAALACKVASLKALLSAGADVNRADAGGVTPLMHAADTGCDKAVLAFLLGAGANARLMDDNRKSALTYAFYAQHLTPSPAVTDEQCMARRRRGQRRASGLMLSPASPTCAGNGSAAAAGSNGDATAAAAAADAAAAAGATDALPSHGAVLRVLLSYGALSLHPDSINTRLFPGMAGRTQLHVAVRRGDARAVEVLLASGADVDARDDAHGNTPLHYYAIPAEFDEEAAAAIVEALLHHGADPNARNAAGLQPLDLACRQDRPPSGGSRHGSGFAPPPVRPRCVTIHAHLVAHGATHSEAFRNSPALTRGKSLSRVLFSAQSFGSIRSARSNPRSGLAPSQASSSSLGTGRAPSGSGGSAAPAALARR